MLKLGDKVQSGKDGELEVVAVEQLDNTSARVYNLKVAGYHSYAVGTLEAWVHNGAGFSPGETAALTELFGKGFPGAAALKGRLSHGPVCLPTGITTEVLLKYRAVATKAIDKGKDKLGAQRIRREVIDTILNLK